VIAALCYRQWLALRIPLLVAAAFVTLVSVVFVLVAANADTASIRAGLHVRFSAFAAIHIAIGLGGTGLLRSWQTGLAVAPQFTFSLPVARVRFLLVWLAITWTATVVLLSADFFLHTGLLILSGGPVPVAEMARTSLLAATGAGSLLALLGLLTMPAWSAASAVPFLIWLLLWWGQWDRVVAFLAATDAPIVAVAGAVATTGLGFVTAWAMLQRREF
jgi:hypothetical protein